MRKMPVDKLPLLCASLASDRPLWLPERRDGRVDFTRWREGTEVCLDAKTVQGGKNFFFPQSEDIVAFTVKEKRITVREQPPPDAPFVVFGMRGCDVASLAVLDQVFLSDPGDGFYEARRGAGTVIALACGEPPDDACFCAAFGSDPANPGGDVSLWIKDGHIHWQARSEKGERLTGELGAFLEAEDGEAGDSVVGEQRAGVEKALRESSLRDLVPPKIEPEDLNEWFDSPLWIGLSQGCLGCGACTFVCPTCQCYDIVDKNRGDDVRRVRCWDSCMYSDFTRMSHGNPRNTQRQRFRQRFLHKLVYFPQNNDGMYGCVGCGRCLARCPSSLNIVKVVKAMGGARA